MWTHPGDRDTSSFPMFYRSEVVGAVRSSEETCQWLGSMLLGKSIFSLKLSDLCEDFPPFSLRSWFCLFPVCKPLQSSVSSKG